MEPGENYKCLKCGNIVSAVIDGKVPIMCCGQPMEKMESKTQEQEGKEKHVPVLETDGNKVTITVGSVPHPMEEAHYIAKIELLKEGKIIASKMLYPGEEPKAEFIVDNTEGLKAREICNLHGLWTS